MSHEFQIHKTTHGLTSCRALYCPPVTMHSSYTRCQSGTPLPPNLAFVISSHLNESFSFFCRLNVSWLSRFPEHPIASNSTPKKKSALILFIDTTSEILICPAGSDHLPSHQFPLQKSKTIYTMDAIASYERTRGLRT